MSDAPRYWVRPEHVSDAEPWDAGHSDTDPYYELVPAADYERLRAEVEDVRDDHREWREDHARLHAALERIADMRDREGNAIEMHRDELRGIARAALAGTQGDGNG